MLTDAEIARWTARHSVGGEMIFQMLSRGTYTHQQIAFFIGCPVEAVDLAAGKRKKSIEANHAEYLETRKMMENVLSNQAIGAPARPSSSTKEFLRTVRLFGPSDVFGQIRRTTGYGDWI